MSLPVDPLTLCTAGFTTVLAGLGLLLWPWRREPGWRVPLVCGLSLGGVGVWLAAGRADAWLTGPAVALGAAGLLLAGLRSGLPGQLARALAGPLLQAALLLVAGVGLLVVGAYGIDRENQRHVDESAKAIGSRWYRRPTGPASNVSARTDQDRVIALHAPALDSDDGRPTGRRRDLMARAIETGPADPRSNCHGWVFAAGRYLVSGHDVEAILVDNGYQVVQRPRVGDVAIFRDGRKFATHTALVCGLGDKGVILLESKWGQAARYVHTATDHPYAIDAVTYYRTGRGSHTLAGIGAAPPEVGAAE